MVGIFGQVLPIVGRRFLLLETVTKDGRVLPSCRGTFQRSKISVSDTSVALGLSGAIGMSLATKRALATVWPPFGHRLADLVPSDDLVNFAVLEVGRIEFQDGNARGRVVADGHPVIGQDGPLCRLVVNLFVHHVGETSTFVDDGQKSLSCTRMANDGPPGHNKKTKIIERVNKKVVNESHLHVLTETDGEIDVTQLQQISVGSVLILAFAGHDAAVDSRMFETLGLRKRR